MRTHIVGTLVICSLVRFLPTIGASELPSHSPGEDAFRFFAALPMTTIEAALQSLRPGPISGEQKQRALATLPVEGELLPTAEEATKLETLRRVLIYHNREEVFEVKVVDLPQAAIVLYSRSIVLVSRPALRLLSPLEFQAVVAHEIGHEYFWEDEGHSRRDASARRELELRCDGIAILTLLELELDPTLVVSATLKVTRFNQRLGMGFDVELYPTVPEREQFTRAILDLVRSRRLAANPASYWGRCFNGSETDGVERCATFLFPLGHGNPLCALSRVPPFYAPLTGIPPDMRLPSRRGVDPRGDGTTKVQFGPSFFAPVAVTGVTRAVGANSGGQDVHAEGAPVTTPGLPPSVEADTRFRPFLRRMLESSPTFRNQCDRLAADGPRVKLLVSERHEDYVSARTLLRQSGSRLSTDVYIRPSPDPMELIAHELEHVIEQLDGVDLRGQAGIGVVWKSGKRSFETRRAIEGGKRVTREVASPSRGSGGVVKGARTDDVVRFTTVVQGERDAEAWSQPSARVSGNGRCVVFSSPARLVDTDRNQRKDIYVQDLETGQ